MRILRVTPRLRVSRIGERMARNSAGGAAEPERAALAQVRERDYAAKYRAGASRST